MQKSDRKLNKQSGFTLIELIISIAAIGVMALVVLLIGSAIWWLWQNMGII